MRPIDCCRAASLLMFASTALAQITPGNLIVVRAGNGTGPLTNSAQHMFLDEYDRSTPAQAAPAQSLLMPITISGTSAHGFVTQSVDGRYLVVTGFAAPPFIALINFTTAVAFPRAIARIALNGTVDATTSLTATYSGGAGLPGEFHSAATVDGSAFWMSGTASAFQPASNRGLCYTTLGASTSVQLVATPDSSRVVDIANGQLHATSWYVPYVAVSTVGTGLPTTSGQTVAVLSGMSGSNGNAQPWDFWFADSSTLYLADGRTDGSGGIQKFTKSGSTWSLQYTLAPAVNVGCRGVSGIRDTAGTHLYATTTQTSANQLVSVLDTGIGSTFTTLATAPTNTGFRGVRFVRQPYNVTVSGVPCPSAVGTPTVGTAGGAPISGNANFTLTVGNLVAGFPYITVVSINAFVGPGFPLSFLGGPACALLYTPALDITLSGTADGLGNGLTPLPLGIPDTALWGLDLAVQHAFLDPLYLADALPFGTTEALQIEIGS